MCLAIPRTYRRPWVVQIYDLPFCVFQRFRYLCYFLTDLPNHLSEKNMRVRVQSKVVICNRCSGSIPYIYMEKWTTILRETKLHLLFCRLVCQGTRSRSKSQHNDRLWLSKAKVTMFGALALGRLMALIQGFSCCVEISSVVGCVEEGVIEH